MPPDLSELARNIARVIGSIPASQREKNAPDLEATVQIGLNTKKLTPAEAETLRVQYTKPK